MISLGRSARTPSWCDSAQPAPPEPSTSAAPPVRAKWSGGRKSSSASRTVTGSFAAPVRRVPRLAIEEISPNVRARSSSSSNILRDRGRPADVTVLRPTAVETNARERHPAGLTTEFRTDRAAPSRARMTCRGERPSSTVAPSIAGRAVPGLTR